MVGARLGEVRLNDDDDWGCVLVGGRGLVIPSCRGVGVVLLVAVGALEDREVGQGVHRTGTGGGL